MTSKRWLGCLAILALTACSRKKNQDPQIFFGECRLQVESKTAGADIIIDGIAAGHGTVQVQIPCGEKQIRVVKGGYIPYESYVPVTVEQPIKVTVELERHKNIRDYALSSELVEQVRKGRKLNNPWIENAKADEPDPDAEAPVAAAAAATAPGAAAGATASGAFSTNVEDWR
ncbi:MAG: PEGA domain-containing protein [Bdellovibrionales bacterium]|nr:PEGA domain-containing protein [Bdellovibrionales bacterium]